MKRRSFVGCGTAAGVAALARPGSAAERAAVEPVTVPSFEFDEATVAGLQQRMAAGELTARRLTEAYLFRIGALDRQGPELRSVIETNPEALAIADALDAERRAKGPAGAAPRHPGPGQGQRGHGRPDDHDGRLAGPRGLDAAAGRARRRAAARGGGGDPGQGQPVGVGQLPLDALGLRLERARRPVPQPLRPRPQPLRLELGLGGRGLREPRAPRGRHGDGRLDRLPLHQLRHRRDQADGRPREPGRDHPHLAHPGHGRPDGPHGGRRRRAADGPRRRRPARPRDRRREGPGYRLHKGPRRERPPRRAHRRRPQPGRLPPRHRPAVRRGGGGDEAARSRDRGPRRRAEHQGAGRPRARGDALRVQGRPRGLLRVPRPEGSREDPRRGDRLQRPEPRARDALLRPGDLPEGGRRRGRSRLPPTRRRSRSADACPERKASTRSSTGTGSTPSSPRPAPRPGSSTP